MNASLAGLASLDAAPKPGTDKVSATPRQRAIRAVGSADWQKIDTAQQRRGQAVGKPREKSTRLQDTPDVASRHDDQGENR